MYPLPPELRHLSGSVRFSIAGYPCFYFGQSQNVCKREINDTGTMVSFEPNNDVEFKLFDLTFSEDINNSGEKELNFIHIWPLIASCYINQFYCIKGGCICPPKNIHFYEEYVIPHFFTTYVRRKCRDIQGIRYYTTRDKKLEIFGKGEKDMRNIVLFMDSRTDKSYDKFVRMFKWDEPYNV